MNHIDALHAEIRRFIMSVNHDATTERETVALRLLRRADEEMMRLAEASLRDHLAEIGREDDHGGEPL